MSRIQRKSSTAATGPLRHKTKGLLASTRAQLGDLPAGVVRGHGSAAVVARALLDQSKALRGLGRASEAADAENQALQLGRQLGLKDAPFA